MTFDPACGNQSIQTALFGSPEGLFACWLVLVSNWTIDGTAHSLWQRCHYCRVRPHTAYVRTIVFAATPQLCSALLCSLITKIHARWLRVLRQPPTCRLLLCWRYVPDSCMAL